MTGLEDEGRERASMQDGEGSRPGATPAAGSGARGRGALSDDEVRRRAYDLYLSRGGTGGSDVDDWLAAEREVRERAGSAGSAAQPGGQQAGGQQAGGQQASGQTAGGQTASAPMGEPSEGSATTKPPRTTGAPRTRGGRSGRKGPSAE